MQSSFSRPYTCRECPGFIEMSDKAERWKTLAIRAHRQASLPNAKDENIWKEIELQMQVDVAD